MNFVVRLFLILSLTLSATAALANSMQEDPNLCPVDLALNNEESHALGMFAAHLSHLQDHFGKPSFQGKLNQIITEHKPGDKVIELGTTFFEKTLNLIDQAHLKNSIASTIGLNNEKWEAYRRVMMRVTMLTYGTENKHGRFTRTTEALIEEIKRIPRKNMGIPNLSVEQANVLRARAISQIANMNLYLAKWTIINAEIVKQRGAAAAQQLFFNMLSFGAGTVLVASIIYAGPIVLGAGTFAASFAADVVVAANLARLGQVLAGVGMGAVGAPTGLLLTDTTTAVMEAQRLANNNHSNYACELDRQLNQWRARGAGPYFEAAVVGGTIGFGGGALTLTAAGAKIIMGATYFGVSIAQLYTMGQLNDYSMKALAEYRLAIEEINKGNRDAAILHLQRSRDYDVAGKQNLLQGIVVGALSVSLTQSFKTAILQGEEAIRILFANSSDTLPMALGIAQESIQSFFGGGR